jgi:hypothetical protein
MLHDFASGSVNVMDKEVLFCRHQTIISNVNEMLLLDRCILLQQLEQVFDLSYGFVWDDVHEHSGSCSVCSR